MKILCKSIAGIAVAATVFSLAATARAGIFTWSSPTPTTSADAALTQSGTVVGAEVFGIFDQKVVLTNGSLIDFKIDGSVASATGGGTAYGAFSGSTSNANFDSVLTQFSFEAGFNPIVPTKTITINNLTPGQQYSVQLFALDDRSGSGSRTVNFQDPNDNSDVSGIFSMPVNDFVIATFTAANSSQDIQENLLGSGGNINAVVVRQISGQPVAPQIATQPQATTVYSGQTAQLSAVAYGTAPLTYQWQRSSVGGSTFTNLSNGGRISGATSPTLTITNLGVNDTGDFQVVASNANSAVASSPATLTVQAGSPLFNWSSPIAITTADDTLSVTGTVVGAEVFATAEKIVTLTNGTVVDFKADGSVAAVTAGGNGTASGAFSGDTSNANFNAALSEFNYDGGPKLITLYNLTGGQQYSVQLFALDDRGGLSGALHANYQDANDAVDVSSTIAMGDNAYIIGTFTAPGTGIVTVNIEENLPDNSGGGNINALVVRALGSVVAPQITLQPQSVMIDQGLSTSFTVAASGSTPFTYRWQRGTTGSGIFTNVPTNVRYSGLTSSTLNINNLVVGDSADYQVIVANAIGSVTSTPAATLSVQPTTAQFIWSTPVAITTADTTLAQSGSIAGAAVFGPSPKIVVLTNGSSVDFKNDSSVATATGQGTTTGAFSGNTGNTNFNLILNQFNYDNGPKTITLNNLVAGQQYSVQLFALDDRGGSGTRNANYQDPADGFDYSGMFYMPDNVFTMATFTASGSSVSLQENLPNGGGGNINALVVRRLSGLPFLPQITTQPFSVSAAAGGKIQFTVGANGTPLTYQWQRAAVGSGTYSNVGDANASGTATAQLTITNVGSANTADYRVIVSNGAGSVTSGPAATLTVASATTTIVHRWSFNETSGTVAHDSVGTADGTLQGSATFTGNGYVNLSNPGSNPQTGNSYVSIPGGLLNSLGAVTIECWVTNNGWNNGNTFVGFSGPIDGNSFGTNYINFYTRMFSSISGFEISTVQGDSGLVALGSRYNNNSIASGIPDQYVYTYDPNAGTVSLYINGAFYATASGVTVPLSTLGTNVGTIGLSVYNQSQAYSLPQNGGNKPNCAYLNGGITEVRIYNGVLSTNLIAADYQLGPDQLPSAVLTHRWSFNETSGTVAHDSVGGADGTLQGSATFTGNGYVNLSNPGSNPQTGNSYVSIPGGLLNSLSAVSIECWVTNNGWNNGNTLVGFSGPIDGNSFGANYINLYTRMFNAISAFEIGTTAGDSGLENLGTRVNNNSIASGVPDQYVYVYDPTTSHTITLYTNGVLSGTQSGVTVPLSSLGTNVGTIGLSVYNQSQSYILPQNGGNKINCPYLNGGVGEVRIYSGILTSNAVATDYQLGTDLLRTTTTVKPTVSVSASSGNLTLSWPTSAGSFSVQASPVLGPGATWTLVRGMQSVVGSNYQITIPTTSGPTMFFRLQQ